jgi:hypothetical protein
MQQVASANDILRSFYFIPIDADATTLDHFARFSFTRQNASIS